MHPIHISIPNTVYFISVRCAGASKPFTEQRLCRAYLDVLVQKVNELRFELFAYFVMPDHVHLLLRIPQNISLQKLMNHINGAAWRTLNQLRGTTGQKFWQGGFVDVRIRGLVDFAVKVNYIHNNPVKAELVQEAEQYQFSSAHTYVTHYGHSVINSRNVDRSKIRIMRQQISRIIEDSLMNGKI
jgi:putative transposase